MLPGTIGRLDETDPDQMDLTLGVADLNFETYRVSDGFDRIAQGYDRANDAMTFGLHRLWRRSLCDTAAGLAAPGARLLDVATGTGDVLIELLRERPDLAATGIDPSAEMLREARRKMERLHAGRDHQFDLRQGDCRQLPFAGETFDLATISWGIRNVRPFEAGLREIRRVLKPGGAIVVLESGVPESFLVRAVYSLYKHALPLIGSLVTGYKPAYEFYRESVDRFPCGTQFVDALTEVGFENANYEALAGGIAYLYAAGRPADTLPPPREAEPASDLSRKVLVGDFAHPQLCSQLDRLAA